MKKDSRTLLFERMEKLNPDFKKPVVNETFRVEEEKDNKWIQNAINPEHEGDCTPMTKPSCTPAKKAFAVRAKHHELGEDMEGAEGMEGMEGAEGMEEPKEKSVEEKYEELVTFVDDLYAMIHGEEGEESSEEVPVEAGSEQLAEWNFDKKKGEKKEEGGKKKFNFEKKEDKESKEHEESETPAEEKKEHEEKKEFPFKKKVEEVKDNSGKKVPVAAIAKVGK